MAEWCISAVVTPWLGATPSRCWQSTYCGTREEAEQYAAEMADREAVRVLAEWETRPTDWRVEEAPPRLPPRPVHEMFAPHPLASPEWQRAWIEGPGSDAQ